MNRRGVRSSDCDAQISRSALRVGEGSGWLSLALLSLFAWLAPGPAQAQPVAPFEAVYGAESNGFSVGTVELSLSRDGAGVYTYRQTSGTKGLGSLFGSSDLKETSRLRFESNRPVALEYRSQRKGGDDEENARFVFDWSKKQVQSRGAGAPWSLAIEPGVIDPLMVRLALMVDLAAGKRTFEYAVPRQNRIKRYGFRVVGEESVRIGSKVYQTVKVERTDDEKDKTWLWHAPSLGYLPVRILKDKRRGADTEIKLEKVRIQPLPPAPKPAPVPQPAPEPAPAESASDAKDVKEGPSPQTLQRAESPRGKPPQPRPPKADPPKPAPIERASAPPPDPPPSQPPSRPTPPPAEPKPRIAKNPVAQGGASSPPPPRVVPATPAVSRVPSAHPTLPESPRPSTREADAYAAQSPACPPPRWVGKNWRWVQQRLGDRCVGRLALARTGCCVS